ncbi:MAG: hypothetical protein AB8I08_31315 [Sandaracinaceae bacterium]
MTNTPPITLCRYWIKPGHEEAFVALLKVHWPTFQKLGLVLEDRPHVIFRGEDTERGVYYVETFPWRDKDAMNCAHELPEVGAIWGPMGECCSSMEFPTVSEVGF